MSDQPNPPPAVRVAQARVEARRTAAEIVAAAAAALVANPVTWQALHAAALIAEQSDEESAKALIAEMVGTGDQGTQAAALLDALDAAVKAWHLHA